MNNQVYRKKDAVAVTDEYGNLSIAETDEKGLLLENRVDAINEIIIKLEDYLENNKFWKKMCIRFTISLIICSIICGMAFVLPFNIVLFILVSFASLGGLFSLSAIGAFILNLIINPKSKKLIEEIKKAEEIKQERVQELKEYLEKAKEITPIEEEYIVSLKEDYDEDITELKEQFVSLTPQKQMSRTRRRQGK